jgi:predicted MPP superfamily phosphohydrolase
MHTGSAAGEGVLDESAGRGRGHFYSARRSAIERVLRVAYRGDWPARVWGRLPGRTRVRVEHHVLAVRDAGRAPLRVAFASDLHIGPTTPVALLERAFDAMAAARPDVLALGGDYVFLEATLERAALLGRLVARVPAAVKVAVLGNHDLWTHHRTLEESLERAGVSVLVNGAVRLCDTELGAAHGDVALVGLDDPWTGVPDRAAALAAAGDAPVRLGICHAPEGTTHLAGEVALLLCGHTHGGHLALPGGTPLIVPGPLGRTYSSGVFHVRGTTLIVSRGLGGIELPLRSFAPPDVRIVDVIPRYAAPPLPRVS